MSEPTDYRGYPCKPRQISDKVWYYEQPSGLDVHIDAQPHIAFQISWRRVEAALKNRKHALANEQEEK